MTNQEKFEGFKHKLIDNNEQKYGKEIRANYGDEVIDSSNQKIQSFTETQYTDVEQLEIAVHDALAKALVTGDPASELAQHAVDLHRQWLSYLPLITMRNNLAQPHS